jgi:hypothetical protein
VQNAHHAKSHNVKYDPDIFWSKINLEKERVIGGKKGLEAKGKRRKKEKKQHR